MIRASRREANMIAAGQITARVRAQPWPDRVKPGVSLPVSYLGRPSEDDGYRWVEHCRVVVWGQPFAYVVAALEDPGWLKALGFKNEGELYGHFHQNMSRDRLVHVVQFTLDRSHHPRLLHRDSTHGYTENPSLAMRSDPGEAVDRMTQERFAADVQEDNRRLADQRRAETAAEAKRLTELLKKHEANGVDVRSEIRLLEERLERRARRAA
jgi:hypothetical protein